MKNFNISLVCFFIGTLVIVSCKHEPLEPPLITGGSNGPITPIESNCHPDTIYFAQSILPLLVSNCAMSGCHSAGSAEDGVILNNYENIINTGDVRAFDLDGSDLYDVITESDPDKFMPPPGEGTALSSEQVALIAAWIQQGAKNLSCNSNCDTTNVTYALKIEPLLATKCLGCHSGSTPQGDMSLTGYANASTVALNGNMLDAIQHNGNVVPMPFQSDKLPQCEIDLIRIWIENGAPQ